MGRKPNQLILEFFERGPKLEDASNRYQHTCKSCGEKFPKGRIDSLTNHLVKKCPALPLRDRRRAILQFLPDLSESFPDVAGQQSAEQTLNLPFAPKQGMSGLEALAEVSRQHSKGLDLSGKWENGKARRKSPPATSVEHHGAPFDEFLVNDDRPEGGDAMSLGDRNDWIDTSNAPPLPTIYPQFPIHNSPTGSPHLGSLQPSSPASMPQIIQSQLVMAASAANELQSMMPPNGLPLEPELGMPNASLTDKYFHSTNSRSQWANLQGNSIDPLLQVHESNHEAAPKDDFVNRVASFPRPIAVNPNTTQTHFTTDFSMNQKPAKPKVRGRFTDSRRKEVQEVRKRGACIRCRMLKKPCSGESPCSTCVSVESARLWKQPCIRTRIAEEFSLYSAGLYSLLAFHAVGQAKHQVQFDQVPGRIEATHHLESSTFATFSLLRFRSMAGPEIDPILVGRGSAPEGLNDLQLLDSDTDDITGKLEHYFRKVAPTSYGIESSPFMKATLSTASNMSSTSKDNLLARVLELWIATRLLSEQSLEWHIFMNPSLPPQMASAVMSQSDFEIYNLRTPITTTSNRASYELIKAQIIGAVEKRAANLSKFVMNDLERRLLQRQQANPFETFLVSVILLACVERMCWLFKTWEQKPTEQEDSKEEQSKLDRDIVRALQGSPPNAASLEPRQRSWPLDKPPEYYSQQGERFGDVLFMLLKMRGVPPKATALADNNRLAIWGDDVDATAKAWYESIAVTTELLDQRAEARFEGKEPREWEMKYVSKIIKG